MTDRIEKYLLLRALQKAELRKKERQQKEKIEETKKKPNPSQNLYKMLSVEGRSLDKKTRKDSRPLQVSKSDLVKKRKRT